MIADAADLTDEAVVNSITSALAEELDIHPSNIDVSYDSETGAVTYIITSDDADSLASIIEDIQEIMHGDLNGGEIEGSEVICPRHGGRFCLKTGAALCAPAFEDIDTYPVRVANGLVQVCDEAGGS